MISVKKLLVWVIVMLPLCTYAEGIKFPSLPKSNVESDIINFDYSQMAYPLKRECIGVTNKSETKVPQKRVSIGGETTYQNTSIIGGVLSNIFKFVFILCLALTAVCIIPDTITTVICVIILGFKLKN